MDQKNIAKQLLLARKQCRPIKNPFPDTLTYEAAYEIQREMVHYMELEGDEQVGFKVGMTNPIFQRENHLAEPMYGTLMKSHILFENQPVHYSRFIAPLLEVELCFQLSKDLYGTVTQKEISEAIEGIYLSYEIVDSALGSQFKSQREAIADNGCCGAIFLSETRHFLKEQDLTTLGMVLQKNGEDIFYSCSASVSHNPLNSIQWLCKKLNISNRGLQKGSLIMTGSFTPPLPISNKDCFTAAFGEGLGSIRIHFQENGK